MEDAASNIRKLALVTIVAYPGNATRAAPRGDAIAMAIDPAFLVLVCYKWQLVLLQATPIKPVVGIHEMSVEGLNLFILI